MRRSLISVVVALVLGLGLGAGWLLTSETGLQVAIKMARQVSTDRLEVADVTGRLIGPVVLGQVRWQGDGVSVEAHDLRFDWSPAMLLSGRRLQVTNLNAERVSLQFAASTEPAAPPPDLQLPVELEVSGVAIATVSINDAVALREVQFSLHSDRVQHLVSDLAFGVALGAGEARVNGQVRVGSAAPLPVELSATVSAQIEQRQVHLTLQANGPLERVVLQAKADGAQAGGLQGDLQSILTPFAPLPLVSAHANIQGINPARWVAGAPEADLALRLDVTPENGNAAHDGKFAGTLVGNLAVINRQPGPIDAGRIPLRQFDGVFSGDADQARLDRLDILLPGDGRLSGRGQWRSGQLSLTLNAQQFDAARVWSRSLSTQLDGPVMAQLGADRQTVNVDLNGRQLTLAAEVTQSNGRITVPKLNVMRGQSRLLAHGEVQRAGKQAFSLEAEVQHFNPARFARWAEADINARVKAEGQVQPALALVARVHIDPSRFAGEALSGQGKVTVAWPLIRQSDVYLTHGPNSLVAEGAFGQPGDRLQLRAELPRLALYGPGSGLSGLSVLSGLSGVEGALHAQGELAGTLERWHLQGKVTLPDVKLPGVVRVQGGVLDLDLGRESDAPLQAALRIARLDTPGRPDAAHDLSLTVVGTNRHHRLSGTAGLAGAQRVTLGAEGGFRDSGHTFDWQGRVQEAALWAGNAASPDLHLAGTAALAVGENYWQFGPATVRKDSLDGEAHVQGEVHGERLSARWSGRSAQLGQFAGDLTAGMSSLWSLAGERPWQGSLSTDIADLSWLGALLNGDWKTGGRLKGELHLAGTPDQPVVNGHWQGAGLALKIPAQGLDLANGELALDMANNRLRVSRLLVDSRLQPPPRALHVHARKELLALTQQPGRLEISGDMQFDRHGTEQAALQFRLDRFGPWQRPDQWVLLTGAGQLNWSSGDAGGVFALRGKLAADAGYWQLASGAVPRLADDVRVRRAGDGVQSSAARPLFDVDLSADLGEQFYFRGVGLESRLAGDIRYVEKGRDLPRTTGRIQSMDGRFEAYGQDLVIEHGFLNFQGLPDNPALDIRAVRKGLPVEPGVQIGGTVQRPSVKLICEPDLPEPEKLAWLVLGHGPDRMSAGDAATLLTAAGGLLGSDSGNLVYQIRQTMGIDELGIRQGELGGMNTRTPTSRVAGGTYKSADGAGEQIFSIGKRLTSNVMLSYEQSIMSAESIVKLTLNLGRRISLVGRAGSDNALDIFYTLSFGQAPGAGTGTVTGTGTETGTGR